MADTVEGDGSRVGFPILVVGRNDFRRAVGIVDFKIEQQLRHVAPRRHGGLPRVLGEAVVKAVPENDAYRVFTRMKHFRDVEGAVEDPPLWLPRRKY